MLVRRLLFDGEVTYDVSRYMVIPPRSYLVKPLHVYVGFLEEYLLEGRIIVNTPIVLGGSGVVRIIESSPGIRSEYTGKIAVVSPFNKGVLSWDVDGILSSYAYIYPEHLYMFVSSAHKYQSIYPFIDLGITLSNKCIGETLIVGCDLVAISAGVYLDRLKKPYMMYCEKARILKRLGLKNTRNIKDLNPEYESIILSTLSTRIQYIVAENIRYHRVIVNPIYRNRLNTIYMGLNNRFEIVVPRVDDSIVKDPSRRYIIERLKKHIRSIRVNDYDMEKIMEVLPPKGLGLIISFT